ncbi:hypothetical protein Tco_0116407, partial [Tanacetum coccineum]
MSSSKRPFKKARCSFLLIALICSADSSCSIPADDVPAGSSSSIPAVDVPAGSSSSVPAEYVSAGHILV